jgi:hypothetical protein
VSKPTTLGAYHGRSALEFERVLVTLLRGLGPWKDSVYLVGGLTPRYLVKAQPPAVPPHAGTLDVDVVIELQILADIDAYQTLEENFKKMGFERAENDRGIKQSWRWKILMESGDPVILELLADDPARAGGRVQALPTTKAISALNIPHASIVFDLYDETPITAELIGNNGIVTETVRHANLVSFTCLKALAFDDRFEGKDAHDLIYCLTHANGELDAAAAEFRRARAGKHGAVIDTALGLLRNRFARDGITDGYLKDGPVAVAKFELGNSPEPSMRERRALRQREVSDLIDRLLDQVGYMTPEA